MMEESLAESERIHCLLLPSILTVLAENLHSEDVQKCRLICSTWNDIIRKRASPLLNQKIFSIVATYLPESSLQSCRSACSLWNKVIIGPSSSSTCRDFFSSSPNATDLTRFTTTIGDPTGFPLPLGFSRMKAEMFMSLSDPIEADFFTTYGFHMKRLKLIKCKWQLADLRRILFINCSNLDELELDCGIIPGTQVGRGNSVQYPTLDTVLHEDSVTYPMMNKLNKIRIRMNMLDTQDSPRVYVEQFLTELFSSAPNLTSVNFDVSSWYARTWATDYLATNVNLKKLIKLSSLEHLIDPNCQQVMNLRMKQWPLTSLNVRIRYKDVGVEELHSLLISLKHTLAKLQIVFYDYGCAKEFPSSGQLYKLKQLDLWKYKGQLNFLQEFQSLETLLIGETPLNRQELFNRADVFKLLIPTLKRVTFKEQWDVHLFS